MALHSSTNHVQIASLEDLPSGAAKSGSLALVHGSEDSLTPTVLRSLESEFDQIYFVQSADVIDFSGVDGIISVTRFAAIGFSLDTSHAVAIAENLAELSVLYLDNNRMAAAGLRAISEIETLTSLHVANNGVGRGVAALESLWQLTDLDISHNSLGGDKILALGELGNLVHLTIDSCHIYAKNLHTLGRLPKLRYLSIKDNNIGDDGALALSEVASLRELDVTGNNITAKGIEKLQGLPHLTSLSTE